MLSSLDFIDGPDGCAIDIDIAKHLACGVNLCRDLVASPPNLMSPKSLADVALELAKEHADVLAVEILEKEAIIEKKMGAYLGVAQGKN